jgi:hypothetical protein
MRITVGRIRQIIREEAARLTPADEGEMAVALDDALAKGYGDDDAVAYIASRAQVSHRTAYDFFRAQCRKHAVK